MSKILVTGGAGFIGSHVVDELVRRNNKLVVIDDLSTGYIRNINKRAKLYRSSIVSKRIDQIFRKEKFDYVFHLAGQIDIRKSINNPISDAGVNIVGSLNIIQNAVNYGVKKIIFTSSGGAIYGETKNTPATERSAELPVSPYGIAKLAVEKYLEYYRLQYGIDYTIVRYSNVYGPRQNAKGEAGVISIFINNSVNGKRSRINGNGNQTRDFIYVKDAVRATVMSMNKKGRILNVSTGKETTIIDLYHMIDKIGHYGLKPEFSKLLPGDQMRSCLSPAKVKRQWRFTPKYNLEMGLKETINWFKNNNQ